VFDLPVTGAEQQHPTFFGLEYNSAIETFRTVGSAGVVEGRATLQPEAHGAAHRTGDADDFMHYRFAAETAVILDRHKVQYFAHALVAKKASEKNIGFGHVHLAIGSMLLGRQ